MKNIYKVASALTHAITPIAVLGIFLCYLYGINLVTDWIGLEVEAYSKILSCVLGWLGFGTFLLVSIVTSGFTLSLAELIRDELKSNEV